LSNCSLIYEPIIPKSVERYVDEFIYEGEKRGKFINKDRIKVKFEDLDGIRSGTGIYTFYGRYLVILDYKFIYYYEEGQWNEWQQRWLVFHELGHAVLNRGHRQHKTNYIYEGFYRYTSLMAVGKMWETTHSNRNYFEEFYSEYMDEMFNYGDWQYK
jgi:hypothetical protein